MSDTVARTPDIVVDVYFRVQGSAIQVDHSYPLFSALCRLVPLLHGSQTVGVFPISGRLAPEGRLLIDQASRLRIRLPASRISEILPLAGSQLELMSERIIVGVPQLEMLRPHARLMSRLVTISGFLEPAPFLDAARRQLNALEIGGQAEMVRVRGDRAIEARTARAEGSYVRRTVTIQRKVVVGYALQVEGLAEVESLRLQYAGIGGRRRFGCGLFVPQDKT